MQYICASISLLVQITFWDESRFSFRKQEKFFQCLLYNRLQEWINSNFLSYIWKWWRLIRKYWNAICFHNKWRDKQLINYWSTKAKEKWNKIFLHDRFLALIGWNWLTSYLQTFKPLHSKKWWRYWCPNFDRKSFKPTIYIH
jgi:hypothetical protein